MGYDKVCASISSSDASGVHRDSQGELLSSTYDESTAGICQGLVTLWLEAKKGGTNFWTDDESSGSGESQSLLSGSQRRTGQGKARQKAYRLTDWEATNGALKAVGLTPNANDSLNWTDACYADCGYTLYGHLQGSSSRYYILSINLKRSSKTYYHAIGVYRPWALFGKSSDLYIYDPNVGEFKVTSKYGMHRLVLALNGNYTNYSSDEYRLNAFS